MSDNKIHGDQINASGQAGAVGRHAHAHDITSARELERVVQSRPVRNSTRHLLGENLCAEQQARRREREAGQGEQVKHGGAAAFAQAALN
jgi:hypothetical protein